MATAAIEAFVFDLDGTTSATLKVLLLVGHPRSPSKLLKPPIASASLWLRDSDMVLCVRDQGGSKPSAPKLILESLRERRALAVSLIPQRATASTNGCS